MKKIIKTKTIDNGTYYPRLDLWLMKKINDGWNISVTTTNFIILEKDVKDDEYVSYLNKCQNHVDEYIHTTID